MSLIEKTGDSTHRRTCRCSWGAATPPSPRPLKFWATQIFWAAREIWADQIFTKVSMFRFVFFFFERVTFYFKLKSAWKRQLNSSPDCVLRAILSNTHCLC